MLRRNKLMQPLQPISDYKSGGGGGGTTSEIFNHKFTTAETWNAISGLTNTIMANILIDTSGITGGAISVEVDGVEKKTTVDNIELNYGADTKIDLISRIAKYDLDTISYDNVSFDVSSQDTYPNCILFNNDGSKMYMAGAGNDSIYQYSLSTAFLPTSATYDNISFDVGGQDTSPTTIAFNGDGSKMYMAGSTTDTIYQYSLLTEYDLDTISYDSVSFDVSSQDAYPRCILFNNDGSKLFMIGAATDTIYQYSLSTSYIISTISYNKINFSARDQGISARGMAFNDDGSKVYVFLTSTIYQYSLASKYSFQSVKYDNISFLVTQDATPRGLVFNSDGSKLHITGSGADAIYQYSTTSVFAGTAYARIEYNLDDTIFQSTTAETNTLTVDSSKMVKVIIDTTGLTAGEVSVEYDDVEKEVVDTAKVVEFYHGAETKVEVITQGGFTGEVFAKLEE